MPSLVKKIISGRPYYYLVWNARVDGKPRRVKQVYLGSAQDVAARLTAQVEAARETDAYAICREFGASAAVWGMAQEVGLIDIIDSVIPQGKSALSVGEYIALAAINRCVEPSSKTAMSEWYAGSCLSVVLPATAKSLQGQRFWDAMNVIDEERIRRIEEELVRRVHDVFKLDVHHVVFDATNFFTFIDTQTKSDLAQRGHNKAHRDDLRQVSLALLVSLDFGVPLYHHCYAGNVADSKEFASDLEPMLKRVRQLEPSAEVTIVFDKGNNSEANFKQIDGMKSIHYVGSLPPSQHDDLMKIPLSRFTELKGKRLKGVKAYRTQKTVFGKKRTLVLTWNPRLAAGQLAALMTYLQKKTAGLQDIQNRLKRLPERAPGLRKRTTTKTVQREVDELLKRKEVRECIHATVREHDGLPCLDFSINQAGLKRLKDQIYGRHLLVTDQEKWSSEDIVLAYRSQYKLEHQFRNMKDPRGLSWWPRFHWTDQKIRVHAFYCVVGLLLLALIQRKLAQRDVDIPIPRMVKQLRAIREVTHLVSSGAAPGTTTALTEMNDEQQRLFDLLDLERLTGKPTLGTTKTKRQTRRQQRA